MSNLDELYRDILLEFYMDTSHKGKLGESEHREGRNISCGDEVTLYVKHDGDRIIKASFTGDGCVVSQASASVMAHLLEGKTLEEAHRLILNFISFMKGDTEDISEELKIFEGVKQFPSRVKCATLAWHTALELIEDIMKKKGN